MLMQRYYPRIPWNGEGGAELQEQEQNQRIFHDKLKCRVEKSSKHPLLPGIPPFEK